MSMKMEKAMIIGGGIAGKLAARVLSEFFQEVVILERDKDIVNPVPRKGAPQGEHLHALLFAGDYGLEDLFPGISEQFLSSGAVKMKSTEELAWFHHGVWKLRYNSSYRTLLQSRPHLEWHVQQYIEKIPNVTVKYHQIVRDYVLDEKENRIIGVVVQNDSDAPKIMSADLVVDASGVSSFSSSWLAKRGIHIPEDKVKIGLNYFTQTFNCPKDVDRDWAVKIVYPNPPKEKIGGTMSLIEGNRYIVTLISYHNEVNEKELIQNEDGFKALAKRLPNQDIFEEIKDLTPLTKTAVYRVPSITWRHFEKGKNLPEGLLLMGDSVCRIDPVFGQGMSIAVLEALALRDTFQTFNQNERLTPSFQKRIAKIIGPIWDMVLTEDFRYEETTGKKPYVLGIKQWYAKQIFLLSSDSEQIYDAFIKVMHLMKPMTSLMHLNILKDVLRQTFQKGN